MKMIKQQIDNYFTFTKRERRGLFVLLLLIFLVIILLNTLHLFVPENHVETGEFENEIQRFYNSPPLIHQKENNDEQPSKKKIRYFSFNPNHLSAEKWRKLGLKDWQIRIIHNYEAKGGRFYKKEDLKKIYGIDAGLYKKLQPHIRIPKKKTAQPKRKTERKLFKFDPNGLPRKKWRKLGLKDWQIKMIGKYEEKGGHFSVKKDLKKMYCINDSTFRRLQPFIDLPEKLNPRPMVPEMIELNNADTTALKKLRGIGSSYSKRIVKYREMLGGFHDLAQLKEVYGVRDSLFNSIQKYLEIDTTALQKMNINDCTAKELIRHPYINSWNVANAIVAYRKTHGNFTSVSALRKIDLVNEELYVKIAPYLRLE